LTAQAVKCLAKFEARTWTVWHMEINVFYRSLWSDIGL